MKLETHFRSGPQPFEGDRNVLLRGIPDNARVTAARVVVLPERGESDLVIDQDLSVASSGSTFGATGSTGSGSGNIRWVELDFHARRTLNSVTGTDLAGASLQIDLGGAYVELNQNGALLAAGNPPFLLADQDGDGRFDLPGLTVTKFKLTRNSTGGPQPVIGQVRIRSAPTNLSFRIDDQAPFWTQLGEMTGSSTSPDFSQLLQAFLADAESVNGFYVVPLTIHSDALAKMQAKIEIEFVAEQSLLSPGLNEAHMTFNAGGVPAIAASATLDVPADVPINVRSLSGRIVGTFGETRIATGPRGKVVGTTPVDLFVKTPTEAGGVGPDVRAVSPAFAQPIEIDTTDVTPTDASANAKIAATAVDVLIAVDESCRLLLDLRQDANGKPSDGSILPRPIAFDVDPQADGSGAWVSVPLQQELILGGAQTGSTNRQQYWLVLQSVAQDSFVWHAQQSKSENQRLQRTQDGGLSWRSVENLSGLYRVRHEPEIFTMPIEFQAGQGRAAVPVRLDRFAPLGRVDASLNFPEAIDAVNLSLKKRLEQSDRGVCPQTDHVINGEFEYWLPGSKDVLTTGVAVQPAKVGGPEEWTVISGKIAPLVADSPFSVIAVLGDDAETTIISQVAPVQEACPVELSFLGLADAPGAVAEMRWLSADCEAIGDAERIDIVVALPVIGVAADMLKLLSTVRRSQILQYHRLRTTVPDGAAQAEIRFVVPNNSFAAIRSVSLMGTTESLANADLKQLDENRRPVDWRIEPNEAKIEFAFDSQLRKITLQNDDRPVDLIQSASAPSDQSFELQVRGQSTVNGAEMRAELVWHDLNQEQLGESTVLIVGASGFDTHAAKGATPDGTASGTLRFSLPPRITAEIEQISVRFAAIEKIPLSIVSHAAGEVTLLDLRAEFEPGEFTAPKIPEKGLCLPTDSPAGADECDCCCPKCHGKLKDLKPHRTRANRPALVGKCRDCSTDDEPVVIFGGKLDANAPLLTAHRLQPATLSITVSPTRTGASIGELAVASIKGIGDKSAKKLAELKVKTIADLANLPSETDVSGISRFSSIRETARELTSLKLDAKSFAPGGPVTLMDLAKSTPKKLSASSGRTVDEAKELLTWVLFIKEHIDVGDFRNLALNKDNTIRRRGI